MLKSLKIENCMCHKKSTIKFHKGVNMFVGLSEHGKSAIFNSLYKVMTNRPLGDEWRSWWGGDSKIKLKLDNGTVVYEKSKETNEKGQYTLITEDKETPFDAVGTTVPQDIIDVLRIDRKVNIQKQLERGVPIFLISESPGDVAKFFNKVAGLYKIDETRAAGKVDLKSTEQKYNTIEATIKEKKKDLKKYESVDSLLVKIERAEKIEKTIKENKTKEHAIINYLNDIDNLEYLIKEKENKLKTEEKIDKALKIQKEIKKIDLKRKDINFRLNNIKVSKNVIKKYQRNLKVSPKANKALKLLETVNTNKSKLITLQGQFNRLNLIITKIDSLRNAYKQVSNKFNSSMPRYCPLCGGGTGLLKHND